MLVLSIIANYGCECVPDINTPKEITPDNFSYVRIINALPDHTEISTESNDIKLIIPALYSNEDSVTYQKFHTGNSMIKIYSLAHEQVIANQPYMLAKDKHYSLVAYGRGSIALTTLIEDNYTNLELGKSAVRLLNFSTGRNEFKFVLAGTQNFEQELAFSSYSEFITIQSGDYKVTLKDDIGTIIAEENMKIAPGVNYDIISKGYLTDALNNILLQSISIKKTE